MFAVTLLLTAPSWAGAQGVAPQIVGGEEAEPGAWPWQVALIDPNWIGSDQHFYNAQFCGGSLVAEDWVLTAAHCVVDGVTGAVSAPADINIVAGIHDLTAPEVGYQRRAVAGIIVHENYDSDTLDNDIALLRLAAPVQVGVTAGGITVSLISLVEPEVGSLAGITSTVTGWGSNTYYQGPHPETLHQVDVPIITNAQCRTWWEEAGTPFADYITDNMLCAGYAEGSKNSCSGDSGGPLIVPEGANWRQAGIVSWGGAGTCSEPKKPGVHTRVANYRAWLTAQLTAPVHFALTKTAQPPAAKEGERITFTITARNFGVTTATEVTIADYLPPELTFAGPVTLSGGAGEVAQSAADLPVVARDVTLAPLQMITVSVPVTVTADVDIRQDIVNTATITCAEVPTPTTALRTLLIFGSRVLFQDIKLTASDGVAWDYFGNAVALAGDTLAVQAVDVEDYHGALHILTRQDAIWTETQVLTPSDSTADDGFGNAVALAGEVLAAGAPNANDLQGAVYLFARHDGLWAETQVLTASNGAPWDYFGSALALEGQTLAIGANEKDDTKGAVYIFTYNGSVWAEQQILTASDGAIGDFFGNAIALAGDTLAVGAHGRNGVEGAVYIFARNGDIWEEVQILTASDGAAWDMIGLGLTLVEDMLVVGVDAKNDYRGAVYVFERAGGIWTEMEILTARDGAADDEFGSAVALSGDTLVVSAPGKWDSTGTAYLWQRDAGGWTERYQLIADDGAAWDEFGEVVALDDNTCALGAPYQGDGGAVYIYDLPAPVYPTPALATNGAIVAVLALAGALGWRRCAL